MLICRTTNQVSQGHVTFLKVTLEMISWIFYPLDDKTLHTR